MPYYFLQTKENGSIFGTYHRTEDDPFEFEAVQFVFFQTFLQGRLDRVPYDWSNVVIHVRPDLLYYLQNVNKRNNGEGINNSSLTRFSHSARSISGKNTWRKENY